MEFNTDLFITRQDSEGNYTFHSVKAAMVEVDGFTAFKFFAFEDYRSDEQIPIYCVSEFHTGMRLAEHAILNHAITEAKEVLHKQGLDKLAITLVNVLSILPQPANK